MNKLIFVSLAALGACGGGDGLDGLSRHEVCARMSDAACTREATCEPTVNRAGCIDAAMERCCPDGVCGELAAADEPRMSACEAAISTMSCADLDDGDLPAACDHLDDPKPDDPPDLPPDDEEPPPEGSAVLDVSWNILAGGYQLSCSEFHGATTLRFYATDPGGETVMRDFTCDHGSALTNLPIGSYSVRADLRDAGGAVIQQTTATNIVVEATGAWANFQFRVTTTAGQYCTAIAEEVCSTCAPSDTTCRTQYHWACCGMDGRCESPALVDENDWSQCLAAWGSGQYCSGESSPQVCVGVISIY